MVAKLFLFILGSCALACAAVSYPIVRQEGNRVEVETIANVFSFNGSYFSTQAKLRTRLSSPVSIRLIRFQADTFWRLQGQPCIPDNSSFPFDQPWEVFVDTNGPGGSIAIVGRTRFGTENACLFTIRFFTSPRSTWWTIKGQNVTLNPGDVKYSYSLENCSAAFYLSRKYGIDESLIQVIGNKGGSISQVEFIATGTFPNLDIVPVSVDIPLDTHWMQLCSSWSGTAPNAPLRGVGPSFNFSKDYAIMFRVGLDDDYLDLRFKLAAWSVSDDQFTIPAVRFTLDSTSFERLPDGLLKVSTELSVSQEYFVKAEYDPTIEVLFDGSSIALPPDATPQEVANLVTESNAAAIAGGAVGAICAVAIIGVITLFVKNRNFRARVMPFSARRTEDVGGQRSRHAEDSATSSDDSSQHKPLTEPQPAIAHVKPQPSSAWATGTPKRPITNIS